MAGRVLLGYDLPRTGVPLCDWRSSGRSRQSQILVTAEGIRVRAPSARMPCLARDATAHATARAQYWCQRFPALLLQLYELLTQDPAAAPLRSEAVFRPYLQTP